MKKLIIVIVTYMLAGCSGPIINLSNVNSGMTKQEIIQLLGYPESARAQNNFTYLYFKIHDHAFGRDKNHYIFAFANDKLVEFAPLPLEYQEEGPIDKALKLRNNSNQPVDLGNGIITPNAYGPGIHMDQYGRPVQLVPR